jgi:hypothetical protein
MKTSSSLPILWYFSSFQCHFETCHNGIFCEEPKLCRLEIYSCTFVDVARPILLHRAMGPRAAVKNNRYNVSQEFIQSVGSSSSSDDASSSCSSGEGGVGLSDRILLFFVTNGENLPYQIALEHPNQNWCPLKQTRRPGWPSLTAKMTKSREKSTESDLTSFSLTCSFKSTITVF